MSETQKKVQIVILTKDGKEKTRTLLDSIKQHTKYHTFAIIVIDNGSTDGTSDMIKDNFPDVELIKNKKNVGIPRARNQAIKQTTANYYLFLDNDIEIPSSGWLQNLITSVERQPNIGIIGPKQTDSSRKIVSMQEDVTEPIEVNWVMGATLFIRASILKKIGNFDEWLSPIFYDDLDICYRTRKAGWKVIYDPRITLIHSVHGTISDIDAVYRDFYLFIKGKLRFMLIHLSIGQIIRDLIIGLGIYSYYGFSNVKGHRSRKIQYLIRIGYQILLDLPEIIIRRRNNGQRIKK